MPDDDFTADTNGAPSATLPDAEAGQLVTTPDPVSASAVETAAAPQDDTLPLEPEAPAETQDQAADRARDEQGRFTKAGDEPREAAAPPVKKSSYQDRINEALLLRRKAEQDRDYWRQQAELRAQAPPRQAERTPAPGSDPSGDPEPVFESYQSAPDPWLAYTDARTEWKVRQVWQQTQAQQQAAYQQQQTQARIIQFNRDLEALRSTTPDFDAALQVLQTTQATKELSDAILDSDQSARLALYLARHRDDFNEILPLTGPPLYRALGRLESRLGAASTSGPTPQTSVTRANPPFKPVGSSPIVSDRPPTDADSDDYHFEYMNRKEREARRR
jgi:hypothetical protein